MLFWLGLTVVICIDKISHLKFLNSQIKNKMFQILEITLNTLQKKKKKKKKKT